MCKEGALDQYSVSFVHGARFWADPRCFSWPFFVASLGVDRGANTQIRGGGRYRWMYPAGDVNEVRTTCVYRQGRGIVRVIGSKPIPHVVDTSRHQRATRSRQSKFGGGVRSSLWAALRRPGESSSIRHKEGCSRSWLSGSTPLREDGLVQPRRSRFHAPRRGVDPGQISEPSMSQV